MPTIEHPAFRSTPDLSVNTATRVPTAPELRAADRQSGWLVVNRWTYRIMRRLMALAAPKFDTAGLTISEEPDAGRSAMIVRPVNAHGAGAVFLIHGGGYVIGSNRDVLPMAAHIAQTLGVTVVCPAYSLAPEAPFPAALNDCHAAWHWLLEHAASMAIDSNKIVISGVSAGGGLAASLVQRLHDEAGVQPAAQLLVYPMLDDRTAQQRDLDKPRHRVWSNRNNLFGWSSYLGRAPGEPAPDYAVPAKREDLSALPPTWLGVGTSDLFLDEDRTYVQRLSEAGVDVTYVEVAGAIHGFDIANTDLATTFSKSQTDFIKRFTN